MTALAFSTARPRRVACSAAVSAGVLHTGANVRLRITRRGRVVLAVLVSLPLIAALAAFAILGGSAAIAGTDAGSASGSSAEFSYITVQSGQSLWSIAESIAPSADPRDVISDVVTLNQLQTSSVQPGQRLAVPLQYSK